MTEPMKDGVYHPAPWILTSERVEFDLMAPTPEMVNLTDISKAMCRLPRFTGHGRLTPFTIMEHSLLVHDIAVLMLRDLRMEMDKPEAQYLLLEALLHDAHEVYVGDLSRPLKIAMRNYMDSTGKVPSPFDHIEQNCKLAVAGHFGLRVPHGEHTMRADAVALAYEADVLWGAGTALSWNLVWETEWLAQHREVTSLNHGPFVQHIFETLVVNHLRGINAH